MKITHIGKYYKPVYGGMEKYIEDIEILKLPK
jgi:hypothetical protein